MNSRILQLSAHAILLSAMSASAAIRYVNVNSASPTPPYTTWVTAATTIQDAIDTAVAGDQILVTNGVYSAGGPVVDGATNRVVVNKPMTVQSVSGAAVTLIQGDHVMRCVYLANGAVLEGFTLANGGAGAAGGGGGVWCESTNAIVSNCVLTGNSAFQGGGAYSGTLNDCTIAGNSAFDGGGTKNSLLNNCTLLDNSADYGGGASAGFGNSGGGVASGFALNNCTINGNSARVIGGGTYDCILNNCTVTGNSAGDQGGGAAGSTLNNCVIYYNSAPTGANYSDIHSLGPSEMKLNYCVTTPLPENGTGNLSTAPLFVDEVGGNLRLQSNSLCINAGSNALAPAGFDLDGNPRIVGGTADIGAFEFQSPQSLISYAWLQQYGLPTDGSADDKDTDADGLNNWQEWHAGTNPTNALSVLRLLSPAFALAGVIVSWQSVRGLNYFIERGTDLGAQPPFLPLATNIVGQPGTTTFTDTNAVGTGPFFYRVGLQE